MSRMDAVRFYSPEDIRFEQIDIPSIDPYEVLVKVEAALTCGTDMKAFRQGHPVLLGSNYPSPFGHECAGKIDQVGSNVQGFTPGMRVVAANSAPCGSCFFCEKTQFNLCENLDLLNGAYAQYIKIPRAIVEKNLYEIPSSMPFATAALTEPLACAVHAFHRLNLGPKDHVVILGCGIMGLLFTAVAAKHDIRVTAVGRNKDKLERALLLGAYDIVNTNECDDPIEEVLQKTRERRGADVVLEAVGQTQAWNQAFQMTRKGGTVCLFGGCKKGSSFELDTHRVHYQEVKIEGVFHHTPQYFQLALEYLDEGLFDPSILVTQQIDLKSVPQYFNQNMSLSPFKVAVLPWNEA
ncbi:MAG: alcohol dehydrogenase catalytic domain-containing protein [Bdellovibrionales bacterium]|nr:alcohol dehydrogenase catalytic domain-containing protein [Bdellovibrionales bacterium]